MTEPRPGDGRAPLSTEDTKLITLARATRARTGAAEGAAVRDGAGRTYTAATVDLPSLQLSALQAAVALAAASGVRTLEAAAVVGPARPEGAEDPGVAAVHDLNPAAPVLRADSSGSLH